MKRVEGVESCLRRSADFCSARLRGVNVEDDGGVEVPQVAEEI